MVEHRTIVAALYVQTDGIYSRTDGVEPWDEHKNAMLYNGPYPVIAHPPCNLWGHFANLNYSRHGGVHNLIGSDGGKFAHALACVRFFGGVLEHPAHTMAWRAFGLTRPCVQGWQKCDTHENAWVCEVCQSAYGHQARKRTWLYYVGAKPSDLNWETPEGVARCGHNRYGEKRTLTKKEASATPPDFARVLFGLASGSAK